MASNITRFLFVGIGLDDPPFSLAVGKADGDGVARGEHSGAFDDDAVAQGHRVAALEEHVGRGQSDVLLAQLEVVPATHQQTVRSAAEALRQGVDAFAMTCYALRDGCKARR